MVKELANSETAILTKENSDMVYSTGKDNLTGQMGLFTKENLRAMKSQVMAVIIGLMPRLMMVKLETA